MPRARNLRPLALADLDRAVEIERATFSDPWSRRSFADSLRNGHIQALAVEDGTGRLVGYGLCSLVADEGEVLNIAIDPAARGQGLGRALLEEMLEGLRRGGALKAWLEVRRSNLAAIALYQAVGFRPQGLRQSYYAQPKEDALTMALELGSHPARK